MNDLIGQSITLLLIDSNKEAAVFLGAGSVIDGELYWVNTKGAKIPIPSELYSEVKKVDESLKDILLGADYYIMMNIKDQPAGDDALNGSFKSGLKWPEK